MSIKYTRDFSRYDSMTTEELEDILRADIDAPEGTESDTEMLLYVMEVLAQRKKDHSNPQKTAEESWESFVQNYMPAVEEKPSAPEPEVIPLRPRRWMRRAVVAAVAVVILLGCTVTASAFGFDVFQIIAKWTEETFQLSPSNQVIMSEPAENHQLEYASLQEALTVKNISTKLAPTLFPEGTTLVSIEVTESPVQEVFFALYKCSLGEIKIQIKNYLLDDPEKIEQSSAYEEIHIVNSIEYHIFEDNEQIRAAWIRDSFECYISGSISLEQMKEIIDSIERT